MTKLLSLSSNPRRLVLFGLAAGAAQVAGCGGGGGGLAGIGSGGTGSFTTGVITGLGSIIVMACGTPMTPQKKLRPTIQRLVH